MSFWRLYYHLVWATHDRRPLITPAVEHQLFPYVEKKAHEFQTIVYALNGIEDHIHLVVAIPPRYAVAEVVKSLKGASSHFLNHGDLPIEFSWQRGYGVFSLGEHQRPAAEAYVRAQKEHHRQGTTNRWLERIEEMDDGPPAPEPRVIRESSVVYQVFGTEEWPF
jgi:putative transposase